MSTQLSKRETLLIKINISKSEKLITKGEWENISFESGLSEDFIREFKNEVYWDSISLLQKLSENFIREFKDLVYWPYISKKQKLSPAFIHEFEYLMDWDLYFHYQYASFEIMKSFISKTSFSEMEQFNCKLLNELERKEIERILKFKCLFKK
jgi:hypothetical protein